MAYNSNADYLIAIVEETYRVLDSDDPDERTAYEAYYGRPPFRSGYVNAYEHTQAYGGPEEGGWWRDVYTPVAAIPVRAADEALGAIYRLDSWLRDQYGDEREYTSAAGGADGTLRFEPNYPEPERNPEGGYE